MELAKRSESANLSDSPEIRFSRFPIDIITAKALTPGARLLYAFIIFASGWPNKTRPIWYTNDALASELGIGRRSVGRYIKELADHDLIKRWVGEDGLARTVPTDLTAENVIPLMPSRVSPEIGGGLAKLARGVSQIGQGGGTFWLTETDPGKQIQETAISPEQTPASQTGDGDVRKGPRKTLAQCAEDAGKRSEEALKKQDMRRQRTSHGISARNAEKWGGQAFFYYLRLLCGQYEIESGDDVEFLNSPSSVPPRYARAMNDTLAAAESRGISRPAFAKILLIMAQQWDKGAKEAISWNGKLSVYMIRKHIDRIIRITGYDEIRATFDQLKDADKELPDLEIPEVDNTDHLIKRKGSHE